MEHYQNRPEPLNLEPSAAPLSEATISKHGLSPVAKRVGLVAATLAVGGAGFFAVNAALQQPAGPETPEAAVEQLFEAIENEDVLGVVEVLLPSERESLVDPSLSLLGEAERLGLVGEIDLSSVAGVDIEIDDLAMTTRQLNDGLVLVDIVAGTATVTATGASSATLPEAGTVPLAALSVPLAVVAQDGSWYVSTYYTLAEGVRAQTDLPAPAFGGGPAPVGADTPEGALESLLVEALELDTKGVITSLDPHEARVLYDYLPLFLPEAEAAAAEARSEFDEAGVSWEIERLEASSKTINGRTVASLDAFTLGVDAGQEFHRVSFEGDCVTFDSGPDRQDTVCTDDFIGELDFTDADLVAKLNRLESGVTVVERDGRWYVSTMPTLLYFYRDVLATLEPADVAIDQTEIFDLVDVIEAFDVPFLFGQDLTGAFGETWSEDAAEDAVSIDADADADADADVDAVAVDQWPSDPAVVPPGFEAIAYAADGWVLALDVDVPDSLVVTFLYPPADADFAGAIEVATFNAADDLDAVLSQLLDTGWEELAADGLPDGARRFGYADFQTTVLFEGRLFTEWSSPMEESSAMLAVLEHLASQ